MKLVKATAERYIQESGIDGIYKAIRDAAAICYQTDTEKMNKSPKDFVMDVLLKRGHTRPLEFGTAYLVVPNHRKDIIAKYEHNQYSRVVKDYENSYITTNMRVIMQGDYKTDEAAFGYEYNDDWMGDLVYMVDVPLPMHKIRTTYNMIASRGCTDDLRTHISLSSMCESTRYCNYSKGKFDGEMTFVDPEWWNDQPLVRDSIIYGYSRIEDLYLGVAQNCAEAQQLKRLVPLGVKAELRLCGYNEDWMNFFWRRCDPHADPECQYIAKIIRDKFYK